MDEMTQLQISLPQRLKDAAEAEARRRGISMSALVKNYLSNFLPDNIDASIKRVDKEASDEDRNV